MKGAGSILGCISWLPSKFRTAKIYAARGGDQSCAGPSPADFYFQRAEGVGYEVGATSLT